MQQDQRTGPPVSGLVAELTALAATGAMGALRVGAALPGLTARYGEPWDGGPVDGAASGSHWFGWGSLQPVFCRCGLLERLFIPVWHGELELPVPGGGLRTVDSHVTESVLTAALNAAGLSWRTVTYENLSDQRTLELTPAEDVWVNFVLTDRESYDDPPLQDWVLSKASLWGIDHANCPETGSPETGSPEAGSPHVGSPGAGPVDER
ncbi:hypothetical protein J5Y04_26330 [Kitasatospora sp. RG8]|uniref:hypothetical protein n=1 Tax=Kitasatospora sp. RG8 TaxID=2820815 RepID=UPI001ADFB047|nr:hypothetical protein [Kitasatospora sp. RG8]MBP0453035.1 hypothetical protein [Kitasatospora sp. RG8]